MGVALAAQGRTIAYTPDVGWIHEVGLGTMHMADRGLTARCGMGRHALGSDYSITSAAGEAAAVSPLPTSPSTCGFSLSADIGPVGHQTDLWLCRCRPWRGLRARDGAGLDFLAFSNGDLPERLTLPNSVGAAVFTGLTPLFLAWLVRNYGLAAPMIPYLTACVVALVIAYGLTIVPLFLGTPLSAVIVGATTAETM